MVGIFPNESSYVRLVTTYLMEYAEDWSVSKAFLSQESIAATLLVAAYLHFFRSPFCEHYLTRSRENYGILHDMQAKLAVFVFNIQSLARLLKSKMLQNSE